MKWFKIDVEERNSSIRSFRLNVKVFSSFFLYAREAVIPKNRMTQDDEITPKKHECISIIFYMVKMGILSKREQLDLKNKMWGSFRGLNNIVAVYSYLVHPCHVITFIIFLLSSSIFDLPCGKFVFGRLFPFLCVRDQDQKRNWKK